MITSKISGLVLALQYAALILLLFLEVDVFNTEFSNYNDVLWELSYPETE